MTRDEFPHKVRLSAFERSNGHCEKCTAKLFIGKFHFDHVVPDALGGKPTLNNCQVLCSACHGTKTAKTDVPQIAKANRQRARYLGAKPRPKQSKWKRRVDGTVVLRNP